MIIKIRNYIRTKKTKEILYEYWSDLILVKLIMKKQICLICYNKI